MNLMIRAFPLFTVLLLFAGCAGERQAIKGPMMPGPVGIHLGLADLVDRPDVNQRAAAYLDEIATDPRGFALEIRMVLDREWGPQTLVHVVPVIRAKGFKLLAILSPGIQTGGAVNVDADMAWLEHAIPRVTDVLIGVQLANEQWNTNVSGRDLKRFPPGEYARWHDRLARIVRRLAPGVPIVEGDVSDSPESRKWWSEVLAVGPPVDYDFLSWHIYPTAITKKPPPTYGKRVWITEAGSREECLLPAEKCFLYVWAGVAHDQRWAKRPGGGFLP